MCSTFKALAASAILHRVDTDCEDLGRRIVIRKTDPKGWSPITEKQVGQEMTLEALCAAAICYSDNGAANLLLRALGGPPGVNGYLRSIGDRVTRLDRWELGLNRVGLRDVRDTTTPAAMQENLPQAGARPGAIAGIAGAADRLAGRQQDGRRSPASRRAAGLAGRRQDRHRSGGRWVQRRGGALAAGPGADRGGGLQRRIAEGRPGPQRGLGGDRPDRGQHGVASGCAGA